MKKSRLILVVAAAALALLVLWLWLSRAPRVDMAAYAPADSLLYLEANQPLTVLDAVTGTEAWRNFEAVTQTHQSGGSSSLRNLIGWTGIGPVQSVVLARAQVAVVVTRLDMTESGDTLKVKSEGAILIETHTSEFRIRSMFEDYLKSFAEKLYRTPALQRITADGIEFIQWTAPDGSRKVVGTIAGSLVIVGTSQEVVANCLAVSQGRKAALKDDSELKRLRAHIGAGNALSFGYVPGVNSSKLLSLGIPLLLGRAPGDSDFQRLITSGATKVFGSLAWASRPHKSGIEDRYLIALQSPVVDRLKPNFTPARSASNMQAMIPEGVQSVTSYRFNDFAATWQSFKGAVSGQVDALSAIVFSTLLKASLLSYGISDPETFLRSIGGEVLTMRLDEAAERSILVAGTRDREALRTELKKSMPSATTTTDQLETFEDATGESGAVLASDYIVMGHPGDVRRYVEMRKAGETIQPDAFAKISLLGAPPSNANIITFTNDGPRVTKFFETIQATGTSANSNRADFLNAVSGLPYAVTETTLSNYGLERTTRSPLGQFSTLLPLLLPE